MLESLEDGYSPPRPMHAHNAPHPPDEPDPSGTDDSAPNPTQLPVEPEFGQALPPAEPEDPTVKPPVI